MDESSIFMVKVGDAVEKIDGTKFPGEIRAIFRTKAGHWRVVVECTVPGVEGLLHIYRPDQLRLAHP